MPELITFRGQPVKRRRRTADGLRLILMHPISGQEGSQHMVSQADWKRYGKTQFYPKDQMPDVRALAAQFNASKSSIQNEKESAQ